MAIAQKRDFFEVERRLGYAMSGGIYRDQLMEAVSGILWKGDFVVKRLVKGSVLIKLTERSKAFDGDDESLYDEATETGRGLELLGIVKDPDTEKWLVDGVPVEADKAYEVATTDFLAGGDTGYPELAIESAPRENERIYSQRPPRLWQLVFAALTGLNGPGRNLTSLVPMLTWTRPFSAPPDPTLSQLMGDYFRNHTQPMPTLPGVFTATSTPLRRTYTKPLVNAETLTQWRPMWRLVVEKSGFGFTRYNHNQGGQIELLKEFEGMPDSRVVAANAANLSVDWAGELRRERRRTMSFVRSEGTLQRNEIQAKSDNRIVRNYPLNEVSVESGYRVSFGNNIRQTPWTGLVLSGIWTSQMAAPRFNTALTYESTDGLCAVGRAEEGKPCAGSYDARIGKTSRAMGKIGVRREGRDYWIETGWNGGTVRRPVEYKVRGTDVRNCDLRIERLEDCLKGFAVLGAEFLSGRLPRQMSKQEGAPEMGIFLNFNWTLPVSPSGKKIELTNRGRYFFDREQDIWFDTRLSNAFTASFSLPLAGGLTFKPTWTLFHFIGKGGERRTAGTSSMRSAGLLMGSTVELKLNYSFDWRSGQPIWRMMKHGNGK